MGNGTNIVAYSAATNGKLTAVPGSPFKFNTAPMGANGHFLFGFEPTGLGVILDSLSMAANGALKKVATTNTQTFDSSTCSPIADWNGQEIRIDHSGLNLYNAPIGEDPYCPTNYQSYRINDANGKLTYLGDTDGVYWGGPCLSLLGNNDFAYTVNCMYPLSTAGAPLIVAFQRLGSGELVDSKAVVDIPAAPEDNYPGEGLWPGYYCPLTMASDPTNHMAMLLNAFDPQFNDIYGPIVIGTFTADAKGNLKSTSTYKNMAVAETLLGDDPGSYSGKMRMAPSGKLLAVGGYGLEIFHFNGGNPATKYKLLLTSDFISEVLWDNNNHLYALGSDAKGAKLWVYTITPASITEASGSPYSIPNAGSMFVQPL